MKKRILLSLSAIIISVSFISAVGSKKTTNDVALGCWIAGSSTSGPVSSVWNYAGGTFATGAVGCGGVAYEIAAGAVLFGTPAGWITAAVVCGG